MPDPAGAAGCKRKVAEALLPQGNWRMASARVARGSLDLIELLPVKTLAI